MIRVVLLQRRPLDCDALAALIRQTQGLRLVGAICSDWEAVAACRSKIPDLAILDTSLANDGAATLAMGLLKNDYAHNILFLSDEPSEFWNERVKHMPKTAHLARNVSQGELLKFISQYCSQNTGQTAARRNGSPEDDCDEELVLRADEPGLSMLSHRQVEIVRMLAEGKTIRQCAESLNLAISTLDNHKARLMKQLKVHNKVELVRLAIREGLVDA